MNILITESPSENGYIESLLNAYAKAGHIVVCDVNNFYYSKYIPDILHIHWPERLYKWHSLHSIEKIDIYKIVKERLLWYKTNGTKIVHTIHNISPHDSKHMFERNMYQLIIEYSDILVHHCDNSVKQVPKNYIMPEEIVNVISPHGDYLIHYKKVNQPAARRRFGVPSEKLVILNFGKQRPYKNEKFISTVFSNLSCTSKYLLIAGAFTNVGKNPISKYYFQARNKIREALRQPHRKYIYQNIPTTDLPNIFCAADIVFLGQKHGLNSGLLAMAATYNIPIVCPDIGCFSESLRGWQHKTYKAGDITDATKVLHDMCIFVKRTKDKAQPPTNAHWLKEHSWDKHVDNILEKITTDRLR